MGVNRTVKRSPRCQWLGAWLCFLVASDLSAETVRVASYNLYNYLDTGRWVDGHYRQDYPKPEKEKAAARAVILAVEPDVLALQEIGGPLHLAELRADLKRAGLDYPFAECLEAADDNRRVAILSKLPFRASGHTDTDFKYFEGREMPKRGMLEASFGAGESAWTLFVVHLKSRWTDREDDPMSAKRREGEARALRDRIRERYPPESAPRYLVAGDFNDSKRSGPVRRFLEVGDIELARLAPCVDSRGEAWTFHYRSADRYERVDFLLVSPALWPAVIPGSCLIHDAQPETGFASDHRLIYVDLEFGGAPSD